MVEYLSIYSKDYLQSYHTHIPVSSFGTKKMQRKRVPLCMYMAAGGIKGLIYLEARACFSVHSGICSLHISERSNFCPFRSGPFRSVELMTFRNHCLRQVANTILKSPALFGGKGQ